MAGKRRAARSCVPAPAAHTLHLPAGLRTAGTNSKLEEQEMPVTSAQEPCQDGFPNAFGAGISVNITDGAEVDVGLDSAVQSLLPMARQVRQGILVVRSGPGAFSVSVAPDVPFGTIKEETTW